MVKSNINVTHLGSPGRRAYWSEFFRIDTTTGYLCQKKMIERLVKDGSGIDRFFNFTFTIKVGHCQFA